jgi:hypothetical protein
VVVEVEVPPWGRRRRGARWVRHEVRRRRGYWLRPPARCRAGLEGRCRGCRGHSEGRTTSQDRLSRQAAPPLRLSPQIRRWPQRGWRCPGAIRRCRRGHLGWQVAGHSAVAVAAVARCPAAGVAAAAAGVAVAAAAGQGSGAGRARGFRGARVCSGEPVAGLRTRRVGRRGRAAAAAVFEGHRHGAHSSRHIARIVAARVRYGAGTSLGWVQSREAGFIGCEAGVCVAERFLDAQNGAWAWCTIPMYVQMDHVRKAGGRAEAHTLFVAEAGAELTYG